MAYSRDPDDTLAAIFRHHTMPNIARTTEMGRPMYDDIEVCEVRIAGSREVSVFPATAISYWKEDPISGTDRQPVTYIERFPRQYRQFKEQATQTVAGTPLAHAPFLTEARRAELRGLNIYTVETLASVDGQELKNIGLGGREMKNKAIEYIEAAKENISTFKMQAELDALRARNELLEEDHKHRIEMQKQAGGVGGGDSLEEMDIDQLRAYVTDTTGHPPHGSLGRKTLLRMAQDAMQQQKVA